MANMIVTQFFGILQESVKLRVEVLDGLTDADLAYKLPGANPTLGELLQELGQMMHIYNESFKTFVLDYNVRAGGEVAHSVVALEAWFADLDQEMYAVLERLTDEQITGQTVDRSVFGEAFPVGVNFHTLREGLLIYYGKLSCYLKAMDRPLPPQMARWIG